MNVFPEVNFSAQLAHVQPAHDQKHYEPFIENDDVNFKSEESEVYCNLLMTYFAHSQKIDPQDVQNIIGFVDLETEEMQRKIGNGPQTPAYMQHTYSSRIKVINYKPSKQEEEWQSVVYKASTRFFRLLKFKLWNPDSLTYRNEVGADLSMKDAHGWTALHWAANNDKTPAVVYRILLAEGVDVNARNN